MGSARVAAVSVMLAAWPALTACAHGAAPSRDALAGWESRFAPAPQCRAELREASRSSGADTGASLVVRLVPFDSARLLANGWLVLAPIESLAPGDSARRRTVRVEAPEGDAVPLVATVPAGRWALTSRAFGYSARTDTVLARAGRADTVTVALEDYLDALRNRHNCRPRGFRHLGERACITDQITAVVVIDRVRDMATPRFRFGLGLPAGDSTDVRLVDDERACERAASLYGLGTGPPRRVVLVRASNFYVAYDPAEPVALGELNEWLVLDTRWRVLARLAL